MRAAWDLMVFFAASQALATWAIVSGIKSMYCVNGNRLN